MSQQTPDAKSIFGQALEIASPVERAAYLDLICADHPVIRAEVETLLKAHGQAGSFMQAPAAPIDETQTFADSFRESEGTMIGPYTLREQIGEGGMGLVFVAEQIQPVRRKVALKVIKPGMDTRQVIARFEAERQALALMDHPNIARVLDAGSTQTGQPYFVMELVRGVPITEYCDANHLTPKERLQLFVQVCQAVQHAHQKGVIHRDLKPSNVLVTSHDGVPVPKVIDFGVAKAIGQSLTEKTIYTRFTQMIGTPLYMSPEQAEMSGLDVDTRSDVYSLGVLLYELLTGTTPFDGNRFRKAAYDEIRRIIKEEEPPRPSTRLTSLGETLTAISARRGTDPGKLTAIMRGELDWIVMRCLEKDRSRRYEGATALAKDVQRYLGGDAVEACPPTLGYRLKKSYRRNRAMVLSGLAFAALLLAGLIATSYGFYRADNERMRANAAEKHALDSAGQAFQAANAERVATTIAQQETAKTRRLLYDSVMARASFSLSENRIENVVQALEEAKPQPGEPDERGWEWHYLNRMYNPLLREVQLGKTDPADTSHRYRIALGSPTVVTHYNSKGIWFEVWDVKSGQCTGRLPRSGELSGWTPPENTVLKQKNIPQKMEDALPIGRLHDGNRYLSALWGDRSDVDSRRVRIWEISTGEEVSGPPEVLRNWRDASAVGPGAEWIAQVSSPLPQPGTGPPPATFRLWNRKTKKITTKTFTPRSSLSHSHLTPDARRAIVVPIGLATSNIQVWDLAPESPQQKCEIVTRKQALNGFRPDSRPPLSLHNLKISDSLTAAAIWDEDEVKIYSLAEGKLLWRYPYPMPQFPPSSGFGLAGVSDDGSSLLIHEPDKQVYLKQVSGLQQPKEGPLKDASVFRWILPSQYLPQSIGRPEIGRRVLSPFESTTLSSDGHTLLLRKSLSELKCASVDLTKYPNQIVAPRGPIYSIAPDLRGAADIDGGLNREKMIGIVRDVTGNEIGRLPANHSMARYSLEGNWILTNSRDDPPSWELYMVGKEGIQKTASGDGLPFPSADQRWLFNWQDHPDTYLSNVYWKIMSVHRIETGRKVSEIKAPSGTVIFRHDEESQGKGLAVLTCPQPDPKLTPVELTPRNGAVPNKRLTPIEYTIRNYDIETGREQWATTIGTASTLNGFVKYGRRGRIYAAFRNAAGHGQVWVIRAVDGVTESTFDLPSEFSFRLWGETPDGKLLFLGKNEMQLWDPQLGRMTQRLTGYDSESSFKITFDSTGHRLFCLEFKSEFGGRRPLLNRLHLWDTKTGREILSLDLPIHRPGSTPPILEFTDGKLRYSAPDGIRELDGTSQVETMK